MHDRIKFKENSNLIEIHPDIYLYKNFQDKETVYEYTNRLNNHTEEEWKTHYNFEPGDTSIDFMGDRSSLDIIDNKLKEDIFNFFAPNYFTYQNTNFVRLLTGESAPMVNNEKFFKNGIAIGDYKIAWYLGEFAGGEICFPNQGIEYKPEPNDLLIFKIDRDYIHYTKTVTSGTRYAYHDCLIYYPGHWMP
jgi:hypothetical protein